MYGIRKDQDGVQMCTKEMMSRKEMKRQLIRTMRDCMAVNSAPGVAKVCKVSGAIILASRIGLLSYTQYRRLMRIRNNFRKQCIENGSFAGGLPTYFDGEKMVYQKPKEQHEIS
jgi:hypothetical protein